MEIRKWESERLTKKGKRVKKIEDFERCTREKKLKEIEIINVKNKIM